MAITFVAYASAYNAIINDGSTTVSVPTGTQNNDVMLLIISTNDVTTVTATGWTQRLVFNSHTPLNENYYVYSRVASSEPASYTITATATTLLCTIATYRGVLSTSIFDVSPIAGTAATSGTTVTAPSITTAYVGSLMVCVFAARQVFNYSTPTGMTERWDLSDSFGAFTQSLDDQAVSVGATGTRASTTSNTISANGSVGVSMALRAASTAFSQGLLIL